MSNANEIENDSDEFEHDSHSDSDSDTSGSDDSSNTMSDDAYVEYAYQSALGRSSDAAGKSSWLHELQSGHVDRATLLSDLSASAEGQEHAHTASGSTTGMSDDAYVEYAYQSALGRSADAAGKTNWLHELQSGHLDRTTLLSNLAASTEGLEHVHAAAGGTTTSTTAMNDDAYVEYAYQSALGRNSDAAGKAGWLHELQTGHVDRATLLHDFSASAEGQAHLSLIGVATTGTTAALLG